MTVVVGGEGYPYAFVKGAPEVLFPYAAGWMNGRLAPLTEDLTKYWNRKMKEMPRPTGAGCGFPPIALGLSPDELKEEAEDDFLGLVGMIDPRGLPP